MPEPDFTERAVEYAVITSIECGRSAFIDGNAHVHAILARRVAGVAGSFVRVTSMAGFRATAYYCDTGESLWTVIAIESPL